MRLRAPVLLAALSLMTGLTAAAATKAPAPKAPAAKPADPKAALRAEILKRHD
ncbi:MAG TPA: hypothetical protein VJV75_07910 [Candidatus Polarisedimenticolia bacterium]|nr:hypothetical protein [Candidatus Polarisedimenticolia bacterium]